MAYPLRITELALEDLDAILGAAKGAAAGWLDGFVRAASLLAERPGELPLAPESAEAGFEARELAYRSYRVLYQVAEDAVGVLRVYRGAEQSLTLNPVADGGGATLGEDPQPPPPPARGGALSAFGGFASRRQEEGAFGPNRCGLG